MCNDRSKPIGGIGKFICKSTDPKWVAKGFKGPYSCPVPVPPPPSCLYESLKFQFEKGMRKSPWGKTSSYVFDQADFNTDDFESGKPFKINMICGGKKQFKVMIGCKTNAKGREKWVVNIKEDPAKLGC